MFIDQVKISVKAGNGGNGAVAFRREKYVPNGGPDGGDGGKGGSVILLVDENVRTLIDFKYKKKFFAKNGEDGMTKNRFGSDAQDLIIKVPVGTIVKDLKTNKIIADLVENGQKFIVAKGGRGGRGNTRFKTSTRQAPAFAESGYKGEEKEIFLELKVLADVGLCGYPNVGKSTILSMVSNARPKIGDYHFTTLSPNLGVVEVIKGKSFTMADIPGLIDGASDGIGLGHKFLKHLERTRLIIHIVDISCREGRNALLDFESINFELLKYNKDLSEREMIVVGNMIDLIPEDLRDEMRKELKEKVDELGLKYFEISAATGENLTELMKYVTMRLDDIPMPEPIKIDNSIDEDYVDKFEINIEKLDSDIYRIYGDGVDRLMYATDFDSYEGVKFLENYLKRRGIMDKLKDLGFKSGDTLIINRYEMEYFE